MKAKIYLLAMSFSVSFFVFPTKNITLGEDELLRAHR